MQLSPETPAPKRSRAKAKSKEEGAVAAKPRKATKSAPVAAGQRPAEDMNALIATTAYYLAAERNFMPGHELDDWLEAERRVRMAML